MPPEGDNLDLSKLSDEDLFAQLGGGTTQPPIVEQTPIERLGSLASSYGKGVVSGAVNLVPNIASGIGSAISYMTTDPITRAFTDAAIAQRQGLTPAQYQLQKLGGYADIAGHAGAQVGGGLLGALAGSATAGPGVGTFVGGGVGAGAGETAYQSLKDYIFGNKPKTAEELARQAGEAFTGGALTPVGASPSLRAAAAELPSELGTALKQKLVTTPEQALADVGEATRIIWPTEQLQQAAKTARTNPLGGSYTTAELIPNKEAVLLERAAAANDPLLNAKIADIKGKVGEGQKFLLEQEYSKLLDSPETLDKFQLGDLKKVELKKGVDAIDQQINDLYAPIDKKYKITKFGSLKSAARDAADSFGGEKLVPSDINALIQTITSTPVKEGFTVGRLIKLRAVAGDIQRKYKSEVGGKSAAAAATSIIRALTKTIESTPTGAQDWIEANKAARPLLKLRDEGPLGGITLGDLTNEQIYSSVTKDVSSIKQYKALTGESPEAMAALQASFIKELVDKTPAQRINFISKNKPKLSEAFNGDISTFQAMLDKQKAHARVAQSVTPYGNSQTQALQRLAEANPDIYKLVSNLSLSKRLEGIQNIPGLSRLYQPLQTGTQLFDILNARLGLFPTNLRIQKLQEALTNPLVAERARKLADIKRGNP